MNPRAGEQVRDFVARVVRRERELGGRAGVAERLERGRWSIDLAWER